MHSLDHFQVLLEVRAESIPEQPLEVTLERLLEAHLKSHEFFPLESPLDYLGSHLQYAPEGLDYPDHHSNSLALHLPLRRCLEDSVAHYSG